MRTQTEKRTDNQSQSVANSFSHKQSNLDSNNHIVSNQPIAIAQRKLQESINSSERVKQLKEYQSFANNSAKTVQQKPKKASFGKAMRKSGATNVISSLFIQQHMGNFKTAEKIAEQRAGTIPGSCHVVSISGLSDIYTEINNRESNGYHSSIGNRVINPATGNNQFQTTNSYNIFEFSYDNKGRVKKGRTIAAQFYYDAIPNGSGGYILHHFDGIV